MTLDAIEFMRRFLLHILPPGFVKIRHFGFLANCNRGSALQLCEVLLNAPAPPQLLTDRQQDAVARKWPCCGVGTLCLLGWIPAGTINCAPVSIPVGVNSS